MKSPLKSPLRSPSRSPSGRTSRRARATLVLVATALLGAAALAPADDVLWLQADGGVAGVEPTLAVDGRGRAWVAWVAIDRGVRTLADGATVRGAVVEDGRVLARFELPLELPAVPSLAAGEDGATLVVEAAGGDGGPRRSLVACRLRLAGERVLVEEREVLPTGSASTLDPRVAVTRDRTVVVYRAHVDGRYAIHALERSGGDWGAPRTIFAEGDAWSPRVATAPDGVHVVWDAFDGASFDVWHARVPVHASGRATPRRITTDGGFEGYPDVARTPDGDVWLTWEHAPRFGEAGGLRSDRRTALARLAPGGELELVTSRRVRRERRELPRLAATGDGVALAVREPDRAPRHNDYLFTAWSSVLERADEDPLALPGTQGGGDGEIELAIAPDALLVAFSADSRASRFGRVTSWSDPIERLPRVGLLALPRPSAFPERSDPAPADASEPTPTAEPASHGAALLGDLHRHTHASRCGGAKDGSFLDAVRYARGPGRLDFLAVTDHYQHLRPWTFWRALRDVERFHEPGRLVVLPAVERVRARRGHFNDVYLDPWKVRYDQEVWADAPDSAPAPEDEVVSIPHMMSFDDGTGFDWNAFRADRTRLFEVYQGKRGSYEGAGLPYEADDGVEPPTALARGFERGAHFGLVAASDHVSTGTAFAGVLEGERTRAAVFAALRARRTCASTFPATVDARLGELRAGDAGPTTSNELRLTVDFEPAPERRIAYVELVKDGETAARLGGVGDRENWIVTLRRGQVVPAPGLTVEVRGGRVRSVRSRRPAAADATRRDDGSVGFVRADWVPADLALEIDWDRASGGALLLSARDDRCQIERDEVAVGRARALDERSFGGSIWRQGPPLAGTEPPELTFEVDTSRPASYYARVAWTDGNLAWTSPLRVTAEDGE